MPRELAQHQVLSYAYWTGGDDWRFTGPEGDVQVRVHPRIHTNSGDTNRVAALHDQGIVLQPDFLVDRDLHDATQAWLDTHPDAPAALRRLVVENRDPVARALAAQARDAGA